MIAYVQHNSVKVGDYIIVDIKRKVYPPIIGCMRYKVTKIWKLVELPKVPGQFDRIEAK